MHHISLWNEISNRYRRGTVVLGNGASIAVSRSFGYGSLLDHACSNGFFTSDVSDLFSRFGTNDFELILRLVWQASNVNQALGIPDIRTRQAYLNVRDCLIQTVRSVHPEYGNVYGYLHRMYEFLKSFNTVISLNYDLLVYWTMTYGFGLNDGHKFKDCFLYGAFDDNWWRFRDSIWEQSNTLVFYPHGNLSLCRNEVEQEMKIQNKSGGSGLLWQILQKWESGKVVPLFVSEGTMQQKITSIQNSYYLSTVYREVLAEPRTTLTLYGWGIGEHDIHLLKRMGGCGIGHVAVSVFCDDQAYCNRAEQIIRHELGAINIEFFDSGSAGCWIY